MSKSMLKTRLTIGAKYLIYVLIVYFSYILQVTPSLFSIAGVRPVLVLPAVICIAMFEGEMAGALIGRLRRTVVRSVQRSDLWL